MHKAILTMLLAIVSSNAAAEWVEVGSNDKVVIYADPVTISKAGDNVRMWRLADFSMMQEIYGHRFLSSKAQAEFDCRRGRVRTLDFYWQAGNMAAGETVYNDSDPGNWKPVSPETADELLLNIACGKSP